MNSLGLKSLFTDLLWLSSRLEEEDEVSLKVYQDRENSSLILEYEGRKFSVMEIKE